MIPAFLPFRVSGCSAAVIFPLKFLCFSANNFTSSNFTGTANRQNRDIMQHYEKQNRRTRRKREIVLAALLSGGIGVLSDATAARAAGTAANTVISNTASATYNDPNNAGATLNATSNTVTVTVAEVAGITVGAGAVTDTVAAHPANILPGDVVNYDFVVTNIGNAADTFDLPGTATVTGNGTAGSALVQRGRRPDVHSHLQRRPPRDFVRG